MLDILSQLAATFRVLTKSGLCRSPRFQVSEIFHCISHTLILMSFTYMTAIKCTCLRYVKLVYCGPITIIQVSLHTKGYFWTITKCPDYVGVLIFTCPHYHITVCAVFVTYNVCVLCV